MKRASVAAALTVLGVLGLMASAPAASAAPCRHDTIWTAYRGPGDVLNKAAGTNCRDLNLSAAWDASGNGAEGYAGFYRTSDGVWHVGSSGYHFTSNFVASSSAQWLVLVTNLQAGTPMGVGSSFDGGDQVIVAH